MTITGDLGSGLHVEIEPKEVAQWMVDVQDSLRLSSYGSFYEEIVGEAVKYLIPEIAKKLDKEKIAKELQEDLSIQLAQYVIKKIMNSKEY